MTLSCLKCPLLCALYINLSHLTTNLFLYMLFCVFPVCYDVRLSHLNEDYLLSYLLVQYTVRYNYGICLFTLHAKCIAICDPLTKSKNSITMIKKSIRMMPRQNWVVFRRGILLTIFDIRTVTNFIISYFSELLWALVRASLLCAEVELERWL